VAAKGRLLNFPGERNSFCSDFKQKETAAPYGFQESQSLG